MTEHEQWQPAGVLPADASGETLEALARIYVARLVATNEADVVLGEYERAVLLVAEAEVVLCLAAGQRPHLWFCGPPLTIEVQDRP